jgi:hypothetical protein
VEEKYFLIRSYRRSERVLDDTLPFASGADILVQALNDFARRNPEVKNSSALRGLILITMSAHSIPSLAQLSTPVAKTVGIGIRPEELASILPAERTANGLALPASGARWAVERPDSPGTAFEQIPVPSRSSASLLQSRLARIEGDSVSVPVRVREGHAYRELTLTKAEYTNQVRLLDAMWDAYGGDAAASIKDGRRVIQLIPVHARMNPRTGVPDSVSQLKNTDGWLFSGLEFLHKNLGLGSPITSSFAEAITGPFFQRTWGNPATAAATLKMDLTRIEGYRAGDGRAMASRATARTTLDLSVFGINVSVLNNTSVLESNCDLDRKIGRVSTDTNVSDSVSKRTSDARRCGGDATGAIALGIPVACDESKGDSCREPPDDRRCVRFPIVTGLSGDLCLGAKGSYAFRKSWGSNGLALGAGIDTSIDLESSSSFGLNLGVAGVDLAEVDIIGKLDLLNTQTQTYFRSGFFSDPSSGDRLKLFLNSPLHVEAMGGKLILKVEWWSVIRWEWREWRMVLENFDAGFEGDYNPAGTNGFEREIPL